MKIWYKISLGSSQPISKVEIIRSTEKSVWVENKIYGPSRLTKRSDYHNFFETFNEAKDFLVKRQQNRELNARKRAETELKLLQKFFQIKKENIK